MVLGADSPSSRLVDAIERSDWAVAKDLLKDKKQIALTQPDGMTALHWAVRRGNTNLVLQLLKHGASSAIQETNGMTAVDCAVEPFVERGFDPKTATYEMVVLFRNNGASFATRWLLGGFTAGMGKAFYQRLAADAARLSTERFAELTNYVSASAVWLYQRGFDTNQVSWFQSQMATTVLKAWDESEIPQAEPERSKVIQYHEALNALLKSLRAAAPEEFRYRFPNMDTP